MAASRESGETTAEFHAATAAGTLAEATTAEFHAAVASGSQQQPALTGVWNAKPRNDVLAGVQFWTRTMHRRDARKSGSRWPAFTASINCFAHRIAVVVVMVVVVAPAKVP